MDWTTFIGPGIGVALLGLFGVIYTARTGRESSLPEHLDRELKRQSGEMRRLRRRLSHAEHAMEVWSDHTNTLEAHIWEGKPPPPPPRPRFRPLPEEADDDA